jgi:hypothetical protein
MDKKAFIGLDVHTEFISNRGCVPRLFSMRQQAVTMLNGRSSQFSPSGCTGGISHTIQIVVAFWGRRVYWGELSAVSRMAVS